MRERITKSILWIVCSRGVLQIVSFASTLLVARLLTPADYGVMTLAFMWIVLTSQLAELGLGSAILQFPDVDELELNACFWMMFSLGALGYAALYLSAPALGRWFANPALPPVLAVVGLTLPLTTLRIVPEMLLRKRLALDKVSQAEIIAAVAALPVVLGLALAGAGVWALVSGALVTAVFQLIVSFRFAGWRPGLRAGGRRLPEIMRYSLACVGARFCWAAYQQADAFVLGKVSGGAVLGIYSMAKQLAMLPLEKIGPVVNQVASPVMAELQQDRAAIRETLVRGLRIMAWAALPTCVAMALLAHDLVETILTDKWSATVPIVQVLCAYAAVRSLALLFPTVLLARYRASFVLAYNAVLLVLMPLAFWFGARWAGPIGVALAWTIVHPLVMLWMAREARLEIDLPLRVLFGEISRPLSATGLMAVPVLALQHGLSTWDEPARLAASCLAALPAFAAGFWMFGGPVHGDLKDLLGRVFRRYPAQVVCSPVH